MNGWNRKKNFGHNQDLISEWSEQLDNGKMLPNQTLRDYVNDKFRVAHGLKENQIHVSKFQTDVWHCEGIASRI